MLMLYAETPMSGGVYESTILKTSYSSSTLLSKFIYTNLYVSERTVHDIHLSECMLTTGTLKNCTFISFKFSKNVVVKTMFLDVTFKNCVFSLDKFIQCQFIDCKFVDCEFTDVNFDNSKFLHTFMFTSSLTDVHLSTSIIQLSVMEECNFVRSSLPKCNKSDLRLVNSIIDVSTSQYINE